ncbi:MAG TPA: hypothetical protein DCZ10_19140 [Pelotomaculum sp.]|mgnify:CR=1 FL=1|nr:hypothetical protein [Pelotomaculum sp.]
MPWERVKTLEEKLFKRLLLAGEGDGDIDELIALGYFKNMEGTICRTSKYLEETGRFIDARKESLYEAVKKLGSAEDINKTMELAGIKDFLTFVFIAEELIQDGRLVKDKVKNCLLK